MNQLVNSKDINGDTALHVACLCGHIQCVSLLLYYIRSSLNKSNLLPEQLAMNAGNVLIISLRVILYILYRYISISRSICII